MYLSLPDISDLAASLCENNTLERLLLNGLVLTKPARLALILDALQGNSHLRVLELGRNTLEEDEILTLTASLARNISLESLTLSGCGLTDWALLQFAQSLASFSLRDMDLSFNDIGREGASAILDMLPQNRKLRSLSLYNWCWSVGGPTNFECEGFEGENQAIQDCLALRPV
jgi:NLR family CARD domain-containing protein 3